MRRSRNDSYNIEDYDVSNWAKGINPFIRYFTHAKRKKPKSCEEKEEMISIEKEAIQFLQLDQFKRLGKKHKLQSMWTIAYTHPKYKVLHLNQRHPFYSNQTKIVIDPRDDTFMDKDYNDDGSIDCIRLRGESWLDVWRCCDALLRGVKLSSDHHIKCISDLVKLDQYTYAICSKKPEWLYIRSRSDARYYYDSDSWDCDFVKDDVGSIL